MKFENETIKNRWSVLKITFFVAFVIGIVAANIIGRDRLNQYGILHMFFLEQYEYSTLDHLDLMGYITRVRIPVLLLLAIAGVSPPGWLMHLLFIFWNGFAYGFLCVAAISSLGIKAILLMLIFLFPQYLIYVPGYLALVAVQLELREEGKISGMGGHYRKRQIILVLGCIILVLFFLTGIWMESYLNPTFVQKILKIF